MKYSVAERLKNFIKNHLSKKRWVKAVTMMAAVVVFFTTYALILPAITAEKDKDPAIEQSIVAETTLDGTEVDVSELPTEEQQLEEQPTEEQPTEEQPVGEQVVEEQNVETPTEEQVVETPVEEQVVETPVETPVPNVTPAKTKEVVMQASGKTYGNRTSVSFPSDLDVNKKVEPIKNGTVYNVSLTTGQWFYINTNNGNNIKWTKANNGYVTQSEKEINNCWCPVFTATDKVGECAFTLEVEEEINGNWVRENRTYNIKVNSGSEKPTNPDEGNTSQTDFAVTIKVGEKYVANAPLSKCKLVSGSNKCVKVTEVATQDRNWSAAFTGLKPGTCVYQLEKEINRSWTMCTYTITVESAKSVSTTYPKEKVMPIKKENGEYDIYMQKGDYFELVTNSSIEPALVQNVNSEILQMTDTSIEAAGKSYAGTKFTAIQENLSYSFRINHKVFNDNGELVQETAMFNVYVGNPDAAIWTAETAAGGFVSEKIWGPSGTVSSKLVKNGKEVNKGNLSKYESSDYDNVKVADVYALYSNELGSIAPPSEQELLAKFDNTFVKWNNEIYMRCNNPAGERGKGAIIINYNDGSEGGSGGGDSGGSENQDEMEPVTSNKYNKIFVHVFHAGTNVVDKTLNSNAITGIQVYKEKTDTATSPQKYLKLSDLGETLNVLKTEYGFRESDLANMEGTIFAYNVNSKTGLTKDGPAIEKTIGGTKEWFIHMNTIGTNKNNIYFCPNIPTSYVETERKEAANQFLNVTLAYGPGVDQNNSKIDFTGLNRYARKQIGTTGIQVSRVTLPKPYDGFKWTCDDASYSKISGKPTDTTETFESIEKTEKNQITFTLEKTGGGETTSGVDMTKLSSTYKDVHLHVFEKTVNSAICKDLGNVTSSDFSSIYVYKNGANNYMKLADLGDKLNILKNKYGFSEDDLEGLNESVFGYNYSDNANDEYTRFKTGVKAVKGHVDNSKENEWFINIEDINHTRNDIYFCPNGYDENTISINRSTATSVQNDQYFNIEFKYEVDGKGLQSNVSMPANKYARAITTGKGIQVSRVKVPNPEKGYVWECTSNGTPVPLTVEPGHETDTVNTTYTFVPAEQNVVFTLKATGEIQQEDGTKPDTIDPYKPLPGTNDADLQILDDNKYKFRFFAYVDNGVGGKWKQILLDDVTRYPNETKGTTKGENLTLYGKANVTDNRKANRFISSEELCEIYRYYGFIEDDITNVGKNYFLVSETGKTNWIGEVYTPIKGKGPDKNNKGQLNSYDSVFIPIDYAYESNNNQNQNQDQDQGNRNDHQNQNNDYWNGNWNNQGNNQGQNQGQDQASNVIIKDIYYIPDGVSRFMDDYAGYYINELSSMGVNMERNTFSPIDVDPADTASMHYVRNGIQSRVVLKTPPAGRQWASRKNIQRIQNYTDDRLIYTTDAANTIVTAGTPESVKSHKNDLEYHLSGKQEIPMAPTWIEATGGAKTKVNLYAFVDYYDDGQGGVAQNLVVKEVSKRNNLQLPVFYTTDSKYQNYFYVNLVDIQNYYNDSTTYSLTMEVLKAYAKSKIHFGFSDDEKVINIGDNKPCFIEDTNGVANVYIPIATRVNGSTDAPKETKSLYFFPVGYPKKGQAAITVNVSDAYKVKEDNFYTVTVNGTYGPNKNENLYLEGEKPEIGAYAVGTRDKKVTLKKPPTGYKWQCRMGGVKNDMDGTDVIVLEKPVEVPSAGGEPAKLTYTVSNVTGPLTFELVESLDITFHAYKDKTDEVINTLTDVPYYVYEGKKYIAEDTLRKAYKDRYKSYLSTNDLNMMKANIDATTGKGTRTYFPYLQYDNNLVINDYPIMVNNKYLVPVNTYTSSGGVKADIYFTPNGFAQQWFDGQTKDKGFALTDYNDQWGDPPNNFYTVTIDDTYDGTHHAGYNETTIPEMPWIVGYVEDNPDLINHPSKQAGLKSKLIVINTPDSGYKWVCKEKHWNGSNEEWVVKADVVEEKTSSGTSEFMISKPKGPVRFELEKIDATYSVTYDIGLKDLIGTDGKSGQILKDYPNGYEILYDKPNIEGRETYTDYIKQVNDPYMVREPSITRILVRHDINNPTNTYNHHFVDVYIFEGWTEITQSGDVLVNSSNTTFYDLEYKLRDNYAVGIGKNLNLKAKWKKVGAPKDYQPDYGEFEHNTNRCSFYVALEAQTIGSGDIVVKHDAADFTKAVFGTDVRIKDIYDATPEFIGEDEKHNQLAIDGSSDNMTVEYADHILRNSVKTPIKWGPEFNKYTTTLGDFPTDAQILGQIRSDMQHNPQIGDSPSVIVNGESRLVAAEELTANNFTIYWYKMNYIANSGDACWHIDGRLVQKASKLAVVKTFDEDDEIPNDFAIEIYNVGNGDTSAEGTGSLEQKLVINKDPNDPNENQLLITEPSKVDGKTYTWYIDTVRNEDYIIKEVTAANDTKDLSTEYSVFNDLLGNDGVWRNYTDEGIRIKTVSRSQNNPKEYQTVAIKNHQTPTNEGLVVHKIDDLGLPLKGVEFNLQKLDETGKTYSSVNVTKDAITKTNNIYKVEQSATSNVITTDNGGCIKIPNLPAGTYKLIEAKPREGFKGIPEIVFKSDGTGITLLSTGEAESCTTVFGKRGLIIKNQADTMTVIAEKVWAKGDKPKQVTFELYLNNMPTGHKADLNEKNGWSARWPGLPKYAWGLPAEYKVRETWIGDPSKPEDKATSFDENDPGDGYRDYDVTMDSMDTDTAKYGHVRYITVKNRVENGDFSFEKENELNKPVSGATFTLYDNVSCNPDDQANPCTVIKTATSDRDGYVNFGQIPSGTYYMKETTVPEGYKANETVYRVECHEKVSTIYDNSDIENKGINKIINKSKVLQIRIDKVTGDAGSKTALTGAKFKIQKKENGVFNDYNDSTVFEALNAAESSWTITLPEGEYKLIEMEAPKGYYRLSKGIEFSITNGKVTLGNGNDTIAELKTEGTGTANEIQVIQVTNTTGTILPSTGGQGTLIFIIGGVILLGAAAILFNIRLQLIRRNKRKRR